MTSKGLSQLSTLDQTQHSSTCKLFNCSRKTRRNGGGPPPNTRLFLLSGAAREAAAPRLFGVSTMANRLPADDRWHNPDTPPDELKPPQPLTLRPKATFRWPPDCLSPFIDHGWDA